MRHADPNELVITLPADQIERLDEAVQSGEYASRDDVILEALRLWEERHEPSAIDEQNLKAEYEAGVASGEPVKVNIRDLATRFKAAKHAGS